MEEEKKVRIMLVFIFFAIACIALALLTLMFADKIDNYFGMDNTSKIENREDISTGFSEREVKRYGR